MNRRVAKAACNPLSRLMATTLSLSKGDKLFLQGDPVVNFYYVKTGKIKLIRHTIEGGELLLHVAMSGETFAEASLFSNEYHCLAISDAESEIMVYRKSELMDYLEQHPAAMQDLLKVFSQQVRDLRTIIEIKNIHSAKDRILAFIIHEMDEQKEVRLTMSLKDIAYKIGLAHETFYRELKKLEMAKVLIRRDGCLKLLVSPDMI